MKFSPNLEAYRVRSGPLWSKTGEPFGSFLIPGPNANTLRVIASSGDPDHSVFWEHVSVSLPNRCPNWQEMCFIKDLFWDQEEVVMQLHPPRSQWINLHQHCLHLWRPLHDTIPLPPPETVGPKVET